MSAALEIRDLQAGYGKAPVLRGLDLTVPSGVTAVLGSSGCGKTTLLRAVAGFVEPDGGSITVAGTEVVGEGRTVPARRRGIGYVPQEGALFPHLTVARNITFGLPRSERRTASQVVADALAMVELDAAVAERHPHQLSGGQQQRVALARALAPRPSLVLLDEPFSSLDAGLREETGRAVVRALKAAGAAAVLVTHDQGEALSLADQVAVMVAGQFLQVAPPAEVYLSPADPRVAAFIGHASMLPGSVGADGRGQCALGAVQVRSGVKISGAAQFAVRSEQLQIRPGAGEGTPGEVLDVSFFGHDATIRVRLDTGEHVAARTPADSVPLPGDRVQVAVLGEVVAFPA
ncbi:sugar ABC transporter [Nocardioides sp. Root190]|uniref:ABC transporter ATP-binding protein n=1 Tax=Nocardioides sp. Root190 TaxID=1736488 RepID=UPI0006F4E770|nr:ABC transporter ATP-binding protein [Nocardioides sp. Root190]KRB80213.1 sugar ABC transporter [Nocardioides sp. Root190]